MPVLVIKNRKVRTIAFASAIELQATVEWHIF